MDNIFVAGLFLLAFLLCAIPFFMWRAHVRHMQTYREEKRKLVEEMSAEERLQHEARKKSEEIANEGALEEMFMLPVYLGILFVIGVIVWAVGKTVITWAFGVTFPS